MLGATVMPHNLYLHSALVQTRRIGHSVAEKRTACKYNLIDCVVALNGAMFINAAILILAGAVFFRAPSGRYRDLAGVLLLAPLLGTVVASKLFGIALFCSGQSSTLTGTMAGQIIMEGFLNIRMQPWLRRLVTRLLAIVPAFMVIWISGNSGTLKLLILSQVVLNLQLPFAIVPLLHFTNDPQRMGAFASGWALADGRMGDGAYRGGAERLAGGADDQRLGSGRGIDGRRWSGHCRLRMRRAARPARVDHHSAVPAPGGGTCHVGSGSGFGGADCGAGVPANSGARSTIPIWIGWR